MENKNKKIKVFVAMSGGVDSSVAAALLKEAGFYVVGIMAKFWKGGQFNGENRCCSDESEKSARLTAKKIGIPFYVVNLEKEFKKQVADYFLAEYKKGNTPNPCVVCNKEIKFGLLLQKAMRMGANFLATGHYAILNFKKQSASGRTKTKNSGIKLLKGKDKVKDQSYFLWQLNQSQLKNVLFPVGKYTKFEVRALAKKFDLPTVEISESQEVCFVQNTINEFLRKYLRNKKGEIFNVDGKQVGYHQGLWFYTIGQRRGLYIPQGPWFVVGKNFKKNILIVSKNKKDLLKKALVAEKVNWILPQNFPIKSEVKIRYKSGFAKAKILKYKKNSVKVVFDKSQTAITPGQSAVFYKGRELLGGGIIVNSK